MGRRELGMKTVNPELAFDVSKHEAAQTAPAVSVLTRFKDDVAAHANYANTSKFAKMLHLSDKAVKAFFLNCKGNDTDEVQILEAEADLQLALVGVTGLLKKLRKIRDEDAQMLQETIPMLECAANLVPAPTKDKLSQDKSSATTDLAASAAKTRFLLNRIAGQNSFVWIEFLFGTLLSSKGEEDLLKLNPYLPANTVTAIMRLITLCMLRANRLGHTNRCIGTAISLEGLLNKVCYVLCYNKYVDFFKLILLVMFTGIESYQS